MGWWDDDSDDDDDDDDDDNSDDDDYGDIDGEVSLPYPHMIFVSFKLRNDDDDNNDDDDADNNHNNDDDNDDDDDYDDYDDEIYAFMEWVKWGWSIIIDTFLECLPVNDDKIHKHTNNDHN